MKPTNRDEGIIFDNNWTNNYSVETAQNEINGNNSQLESPDENQQSNVDSETLDNKDELTEDETEIPAGVTDTMFTTIDFLEDNERHKILNIAPAEGDRPLSAFRDKYCEELAYHGSFLGQGRPENKKRIVDVN